MSQPVLEFNGDFSEPGAKAVPWAEAEAVLATSEMFWLSTVRRDGRPHVTPLPTVYLDGTLYFCAGELEQKSVNLRSNSQCVLTTGTNQLHSGLDVVVEGEAIRVTDHDTLVRLDALWKSKLDWHFSVAGDHFGDPAGRKVLVFGIKAAKVLSFGKDPYTQTRYRFS